MKATTVLLLLAFAPFVMRPQEDAAGVYTNVDGIVLGLIFSQTTFHAGNYVNAVMVVSNASPTTAMLRQRFTGWDIRDTGIGDYVVTDASGKVLPKVVWALSHWQNGAYAPPPWSTRHDRFPPGASMEYPGDIVRRYSLTNPGVYQVKAIAEVPRPVERAETMVIETPPITITVTPSLRPGDDRDLYKPQELAMIPELSAFAAAQPPLRVTHSASVSAVQTPAPKPKEDEHHAAAPPKDEVTSSAANVEPVASITGGAEARPVLRRGLYYAVPIGLGVLVIAAILWRTRRSAQKG